MTKNAFTKSFKNALKKLYAKDSELLKKDFDINERTVTHRLGLYLASLFPGFDVDCEYNRMVDHNGNVTEGDCWAKSLNLTRKDWPSPEDDQAKTVFPDIIIHKRQQPVNLAVIEVKMKWKNSKKDFDYQKLVAYKIDLKYQFAVFLEIDEKEYFIDFV